MRRMCRTICLIDYRYGGRKEVTDMPQGKTAEARVDMRAPKHEIALWKRAAAAERVSVAEFMRNACTLAAVRALPEIANEEC